MLEVGGHHVSMIRVSSLCEGGETADEAIYGSGTRMILQCRDGLGEESSSLPILSWVKPRALRTLRKAWERWTGLRSGISWNFLITAGKTPDRVYLKIIPHRVYTKEMPYEGRIEQKGAEAVRCGIMGLRYPSRASLRSVCLG